MGRRHLLVTGKDAVYHHPAVWIFISSGLNGWDQRANNRCSEIFLSLPGAEKAVILWVNTRPWLFKTA